MRVLRDTTFEFGYLVWQFRPPQPAMMVLIKGTFDLVPGGTCAIAGKQQICHGEVYVDDEPSNALLADTDMALLKPRGECFLAGSCYAVGGAPATAVPIVFRVGAVRKQIAVIGDRHWVRGSASAPEPFTTMALGWNRAFGGSGFERNPVGVGIDPVKTATGPAVPLPNLEDPHRLITAPSVRPEPVGFFPIARTWAARARRTGTYNKRWVDTRWPWLPEDFDIGYFNSAPPDQQIPGYWRGDEEIFAQNVHPQHARIDTLLPGVRARAFLVVRSDAGATDVTLREVTLHLDTITVDAEALQVTCLWRGVIDVQTEKLTEVERLFYYHEPIDADRSADIARARYEHTLAVENGEDEEFEPVEPSEVVPAADEAVAGGDDEDAGPRGKIDALLLPLGLTLAGAAESLPEAPASPKPSELKAGMEAEGAEVPAELAAAADPEAPPPEDEPPPPPPDFTREDVSARAALHEPFADMDLSDLDLSGLDLSGADFSKAIMRRTNLSGCRLAGTKFDEAVMAGADLTGSFMVGASLVSTDLTGARVNRAGLRDAVLDDAIGERGEFRGVNFTGASLKNAEFAEADATEANFQRATLDGADFSRSDVTGADFSEASLLDTQFERACGERANFERAKMKGARFSEGAKFDHARFHRAIAPDTQWQDSHFNSADFSSADLDGANFASAQLVEANFTAAKLKKATFQDAVLVGATMISANVFEGSFEGADVSHADMRGANLFGAMFWRARTLHTRFAKAMVTRTHIDPART